MRKQHRLSGISLCQAEHECHAKWYCGKVTIYSIDTFWAKNFTSKTWHIYLAITFRGRISDGTISETTFCFVLPKYRNIIIYNQKRVKNLHREGRFRHALMFLCPSHHNKNFLMRGVWAAAHSRNASPSRLTVSIGHDSRSSDSGMQNHLSWECFFLDKKIWLL